MRSTGLLCAFFMLFSSTIVNVAAQSTSSKQLEPILEGDKIVVGSKAIWIKDYYFELSVLLDNQFKISGNARFDFGEGEVAPCFFINRKVEKTKDSVIWTGDMVTSRGRQDSQGTYTLSIKLLESGKIKVLSHYRLKPGIKLVATPIFAFHTAIPLTGKYTIDGKTIKLDKNVDLKLTTKTETTLTLFPDCPEKKLAITPITCDAFKVFPKQGCLQMTAPKDTLEFILDIRGETSYKPSNNYYGGVDFGKIDNLNLPQYRKCRNLIQNPSFEAGLKYYGYRSYGCEYWPEEPDTYQIDSDHAKFGENSLRIKALKAMSLPLGTFAIPLTPGKKYVLSFYAKGNLPEGVSIRLSGRATVTYWLFSKGKKLMIPITDEWKRYEISFTPTEEFYSIYFQGVLSHKSKEKQGTIWLDGLQLEEEKLTDYTERPYHIQLVSSSRGNFLHTNQKPNFKLILKAKPKQHGSLEISVKNFFDNTIFRENRVFTIDENGKLVIKLTDLDKKILLEKLNGVYVMKTVLTFKGDQETYQDFFRFSIMYPVGNYYKNKNIFSISPGGVTNVLCAEVVDRILDRLRFVGFGSGVYMGQDNLDTDKHIMSKLHEYNFMDMGRKIINKRVKDGTVREGERELSNIRNISDPTPEQLKEFEEICELKARNRPWVNTWFFDGEIEGMKPLVDNPVSLGKFVAAAYRGIKKGNPNAIVHMGGGPWNIDENGREWYDEFMAGVKEADPSIKYDGTAIHIYREMPETPDLDDATAKFLDILKKYGYADKPIYWEEGGNYFEYFMPGKGMTPYYGNSGDKWYPCMLTYDMGKAERISAAFAARTWLVALKYMNNIACLNDWNMRRYFWDADLTAGAKLKVVNTLARILGDSKFHKDIRFAANCRCYMFIDDQKRPVAVLWGHDQLVDKWMKTPPRFKFDFSGQSLRFVDMMDNRVTFPVKAGYTQIPLGPYPLFIIGNPGTENQLAASIAQAKSLEKVTVPIEISAIPIDKDKAELTLTNTLTAPINADIHNVINSQDKTFNCDLNAQQTVTEVLPLPKNDNFIKTFSLDIKANASEYVPKEKKIDGNYAFLSVLNKIAIDGKADEWNDIPKVSLGPKVSAQIATCGNTLYLAIQTSDLFSTPTILINPKTTNKDWAEFKTKEQNIFVYEIQKQEDATLKAFTHYVPWVLADSGDWTPKARCLSSHISGKAEMTNVGAFYEIAIPAAAIMPLKLEKGEKFGLNIVMTSGNKILSLNPVEDYTKAGDPGKFKLVLSFVK